MNVFLFYLFQENKGRSKLGGLDKPLRQILLYPFQDTYIHYLLQKALTRFGKKKYHYLKISLNLNLNINRQDTGCIYYKINFILNQNKLRCQILFNVLINFNLLRHFHGFFRSISTIIIPYIIYKIYNNRKKTYLKHLITALNFN